MARTALAAVALTWLAAPAAARVVTLHNDRPRLDVAGAYVDAHDGMILAVGSPPVYYLYGEAYGNTTGSTFPWGAFPTLAVYTSPDLLAWTYRGAAIVNATPSLGTQWIPNVFYDAPRSRFVMWFGTGDWSVAVSHDGIAFNVVAEHVTSRLGGGTDGTGIFIDDDGTGYVAFAALANAPGESGHLVSIERLADNYTASSLVNVTGFFPDGYVESPALFKRGATYYLTYGSCCCACRGGGGIVVFTAPAVGGPWTRQVPWADVNCGNASAPICGGFGARTTDRAALVYNAQWWGASLLPTSTGATTYLFTGRRWLSGAGNPPACDDLCGNNGRPMDCVAPDYLLATDYDVWYPLAFDDAGAVAPLQPLPSFQLDIP